MNQKAFTLFELIITVAIMGILAAVVTPRYLETQAQAKLEMSRSNLVAVRSAFINYFFEGVFSRSAEKFPPEPTDNILSTQWASTTTLSNGSKVSQLFSEGVIPLNSDNNPFSYYLLEETATENSGFRLSDTHYNLEYIFRP